MTQTNTPDIDSKLGKIIETYFFVIHHSCGIDADPADGFGECTCNAEAEAKQAIKELFQTSNQEAYKKGYIDGGIGLIMTQVTDNDVSPTGEGTQDGTK